MREQDPRNPDNEAEADFEVVGPGVGGAQIVSPRLGSPTFGETQPHDEAARKDMALEDDTDVESFEDDSELLNPGSPEFEHLTKPTRLERHETPEDDVD
jgi:hypothetical protein